MGVVNTNTGSHYDDSENFDVFQIVVSALLDDLCTIGAIQFMSYSEVPRWKMLRLKADLLKEVYDHYQWRKKFMLGFSGLVVVCGILYMVLSFIL